MADKTILLMPGKRMSVPKMLKRTVQIALAVALTAVMVLAVLVISGLLQQKGGTIYGLNVWYAFIKRSDIWATMILTAIVTVSFIYWQRGQERHSSGDRR